MELRREPTEDEADTLAPMPNQPQPPPQQPAVSSSSSSKPAGGRRGTLLAAAAAMSGGPAGGAGGPRKSIAGAMLSRATLMSLGNLARRSKAQEVRLENTYRTLPKDEERLRITRLKPMITEALAEILAGYAYSPATAGRKACDAALAIRNRAREGGFERYKLVVFVLVTENRKAMASPGGVCLASRALWSAGDCADNFTEAACASDSAKAHATVHAFYYE